MRRDDSVEGAMGQMGFFDVDKRLRDISAKGDPLEILSHTVPWESFRADLEGALCKAPEERKSKAGRKPWDAVLIFKALVLQTLYNLADEQVEIQIRDRFSFMRFLGLGLEDAVPDGTTLWLYRERLAKAGLIEKLFARFSQTLEAKGYIARGGQIIDATIVPVPKQRNSREENEAIKEGRTPEDWERKPAKNRQKDKDARWTKKHGLSFYGYKNHVNADAKHKLIRKWAATDAAPHDSQEFEGLLDKANTSSDVWADSAYRSAEIERKLKDKGFKSRIHTRGRRGTPLSEAQQKANTTRSKVRVRIEHIFGDQENGMGGKIVRTIGIVRARVKIGLMNLVYNMRRLAVLERMAAPA